MLFSRKQRAISEGSLSHFLGVASYNSQGLSGTILQGYLLKFGGVIPQNFPGVAVPVTGLYSKEENLHITPFYSPHFQGVRPPNFKGFAPNISEGCLSRKSGVDYNETSGLTFPNLQG